MDLVYGDFTNGWTWEGREYERLYEKSMSAPDKYIAQNGSIGHIEVGGYTVVMGCSCDIAAKHEQFIVAYARKIATYLNARAKRIQAEAERVCAKETVTAHAGAVAKESAE